MSESHNATSKKKCKKPLDKLHKVWYNKGVKRAEIWLSSQTEKKFQRNLKFPLDNRHKVWYNTSVPRERIKGCDQRKKGIDVYG